MMCELSTKHNKKSKQQRAESRKCAKALAAERTVSKELQNYFNNCEKFVKCITRHITYTQCEVGSFGLAPHCHYRPQFPAIWHSLQIAAVTDTHTHTLTYRYPHTNTHTNKLSLGIRQMARLASAGPLGVCSTFTLLKCTEMMRNSFSKHLLKLLAAVLLDLRVLVKFSFQSGFRARTTWRHSCIYVCVCSM